MHTIFSPLALAVYGIKGHLLFGAILCSNYFTENISFHQAKILMFYSVQTSNLTFAGQKNDL